MTILFGSIDHAKRIARSAGIGFDPDVDFVISRVGPQLLGGVIFTNYTKRTVQMHMAGFVPRWATPRFMWVIYDFPFNMLKVEQVIATVATTNRRSLDITYKMGFEPITIVPGVVPGGDMEILSMSRAECRWLRLSKRYSAEVTENAA